jgi:hypothetical protein
MSEIKKMIEELVTNMDAASQSALNIAMATGDTDFAFLSAIIPMILVALQKGDMVELAEVMAKFAESKTSKTPTMDLSRDAIQNRINLN